jgi:hypothetical protein
MKMKSCVTLCGKLWLSACKFKNTHNHEIKKGNAQAFPFNSFKTCT